MKTYPRIFISHNGIISHNINDYTTRVEAIKYWYVDADHKVTVHWESGAISNSRWKEKDLEDSELAKEIPACEAALMFS